MTNDNNHEQEDINENTQTNEVNPTVAEVTEVIAEATEGTEAVDSVAATEATDITPATPPVKGKGKLVAAIAAAVVVVIVCIFATGVFDSPQKSVMKAFTTTGVAMTTASEQYIADYPIYDMIYYNDIELGKNSFDITLESISTGSADDAMLNSMLKGSGLHVETYFDNANHLNSGNASLGFMGKDLISLYGYMSPELAVVGAPSLSKTNFSFNPKTLATDAPGSAAAAALGMDSESIVMMQSLLDAQLSTVKKSGFDYKAISADTYAIMGKALDNATFAKLGKANGLTDYSIALVGTDLKAVLIELMRYTYLDSSIADSMRSLLTPQMLDGMTYEQFIEDELLSVIERDAQIGDCELIISVNSKKYIERYQFSGTMTDGDDLPMDIKMDMKSPSPTTANAVVTMQMGDEGSIDMKINASDVDGTYAVTLDMSALLGTGGTMKMTEEIKLGKDGTASLLLDMSIIDTMTSTIMSMDTDIQGKIIKNEGNYSWEFPTVDLGITGNGTRIGASLSAKGTLEKTDAVPAPSEHKDVFTMSEAEFETEMTAIGDTFYGLMMGLLISSGGSF